MGGAGSLRSPVGVELARDGITAFLQAYRVAGSLRSSVGVELARDDITAFLQAYRDALIASKLAPTDV